MQPVLDWAFLKSSWVKFRIQKGNDANVLYTRVRLLIISSTRNFINVILYTLFLLLLVLLGLTTVLYSVELDDSCLQPW